MPCPLHRMVLRLKWKKMWTSVKSYCNCKGLINVIPLVNVLCSTYLEGIMPPVPLMCVEVANVLQRFGLKRGQLCLAPHFAGTELSLFFFLWGQHLFTSLDLSGDWMRKCTGWHWLWNIWQNTGLKAPINNSFQVMG